MKYSGIQTDGNLRFLKCAVCGNDEFAESASFCRICGSALYNFCQDYYDESGYKQNSGCKKINSGNSRFCEHCGNPTLLSKYLVNWEDEKMHSEKYGDEEISDFKPADSERLFKKKDDLDDLDDAFDEAVNSN